MATEILIVWPDVEDAGLLQEALIRSGLGLKPSILDHYPDRTTLAERIRARDATAAVVVGLSEEDRALQLLQEIHSDCPGILRVAAHSAASPDALRAVMRVGAADFLVPPFDASDIRCCFAAVAKPAMQVTEGRLIAVLPCQGTDGASTVALQLAQSLSQSAGRPALLVDCDIQCSVTAFRLGANPKYTLADALTHVEALDEFLPKIATRWRDFDLIIAPDSPLGLMGEHMDRLPLALSTVQGNYTDVIADLPPGLFAAGVEALRGAEQIQLVCTPQLISLHLARRRVSELIDWEIDKDRIRVIVNRANSRSAVPPDEIERAIGLPIDHQLANDYDAVTRAAVAGGLVSEDSDLGKDLAALAKRVAGAEAETGKTAAPAWKRILSLE